VNNEAGAPEASVLVFAFARGAYDDHLWELEHAIRKRRHARLSVGSIILSRGDRVELSDELSVEQALESAIVRVVRVPQDKSRITVKVEKTMLPTRYLGKVVTIPRNWVLCPVNEE
jgi:hypothetical protein